MVPDVHDALKPVGSAILEMVTAALPLFVMVNDVDALEPTATVPKSRLPTTLTTREREGPGVGEVADGPPQAEWMPNAANRR